MNIRNGRGMSVIALRVLALFRVFQNIFWKRRHTTVIFCLLSLLGSLSVSSFLSGRVGRGSFAFFLRPPRFSIPATSAILNRPFRYRTLFEFQRNFVSLGARRYKMIPRSTRVGKQSQSTGGHQWSTTEVASAAFAVATCGPPVAHRWKHFMFYTKIAKIVTRTFNHFVDSAAFTSALSAQILFVLPS